jgi:two-component system NtrC family sensor kinase
MEVHADPPEASILSRKNRRILVIDDTPGIHQDFRKVLGTARSTSHLEADESALFGDAPAQPKSDGYEIDSAMQGQEGLDKVMRAARDGKPYAVVFADMRMPPGWDGVETIERILRVTPRVELCICSAYSDYSWHEVIRRVGRPSLRLLRKPFDTFELLSVASELTEKWHRLHGAATTGPGVRSTR